MGSDRGELKSSMPMRGTFPPCAMAAETRMASKAPAIVPMHRRRFIVVSKFVDWPEQRAASRKRCHRWRM
jgi:hypothetical protein